MHFVFCKTLTKVGPHRLRLWITSTIASPDSLTDIIENTKDLRYKPSISPKTWCHSKGRGVSGAIQFRIDIERQTERSSRSVLSARA